MPSKFEEVETVVGRVYPATKFTDPAKQAEFVAGMKAGAGQDGRMGFAPLPPGEADPSFEFLLGFYTVDCHYDLWQAELMARAYPHFGDLTIGFRLDNEGNLAPWKASESDEPQERSRGEILGEIAKLSPEATEALVLAFDALTSTHQDTTESQRQ